MRRLLALVVTLALTATACGGGSDDGGSSDENGGEVSQTDPTQPAGEDGEDEPAPSTTLDVGESEAEAPSTEGSRGTLTLAGETYHFAIAPLQYFCMLSTPGMLLNARLRRVDESGAALDGHILIGIPLEGEEETAGLMPGVHATIGDLEWVADSIMAEGMGVPAGSSQVDSFEMTGNTISGTATFYEQLSFLGQGDVIVEEGEFEVTCVEE